MGLFNPSENSINLKVVYYGPAFGGKTTNLTRVKQLLDPAGETAVLSVNTDRDTTLFFDYLPLKFRLLDQYIVRVQGYTVPGQVNFNTTRRLVLKGADGVVFVADAAADRLQDNVDSFLNLHSNMSQLGMDIDHIPLVIQYNKQDLTQKLPQEVLEQFLNQNGHTTLLASAIKDQGVHETFRAVLEKVITQAHEEYQLERRGLSLGEALKSLGQAIACPEPPLGCRTRPRNPQTVVHVATPGTRPLSVEDDPEKLLEGAVEASLEMSSLVFELQEQIRQLTERGGRVLGESQRLLDEVDEPVRLLRLALEELAKAAPDVGSMEPYRLAREAAWQLELRLSGYADTMRAMASVQERVREPA